MRRINMTVQCQACGVDYHLSVDYDGYVAWKNGEGFIQDLLPDNTASERELLISGACGKCFDRMFWYKEGENE
jgi:hypothetical protein